MQLAATLSDNGEVQNIASQKVTLDGADTSAGLIQNLPFRSKRDVKLQHTSESPRGLKADHWTLLSHFSFSRSVRVPEIYVSNKFLGETHAGSRDHTSIVVKYQLNCKFLGPTSPTIRKPI